MEKKFEEVQRVIAGVENGITDPILSAAVAAYALVIACTTTELANYADNAMDESVKTIKLFAAVAKKSNKDAFKEVKSAYILIEDTYINAYKMITFSRYVDIIQEDPREYAKFIRNVVDSIKNKDGSTNEERFNEFMKIIFDGSNDSPKLGKLN